jgi:hypothetical protein
LKEQVQLDAQTIGILVAEKAELTATNSQCQIIINQKTGITIFKILTILIKKLNS